MNAQPSDQWLIRTAENLISGPYTRQQICEFIEQGQLQLNDEVCHANTYWFYLHEHDEIRKQLGIELPKELYAGAEESTVTETDTEITDPGVEPGGTRVAAMGAMGQVRGGTVRSVSRQRESRESEIPDLPQSTDELGENTAVMSNRAFRDFRQKKKPVTQEARSLGIPAGEPMVTGPTPVVRGMTSRKIQDRKALSRTS